MQSPSPIQEAVQPVLDLFATDLSNVRFPDIDLAILREIVDTVAAQVEAVARAEEALSEARAGLSKAEQTLASKAARALAYARVYAEGDAALVAKIDAITLPRAASRRVRGDPPAEAPSSELGRSRSAGGDRGAASTHALDDLPRRGRRPKADRPALTQPSLELVAVQEA